MILLIYFEQELLINFILRTLLSCMPDKEIIQAPCIFQWTSRRFLSHISQYKHPFSSQNSMPSNPSSYSSSSSSSHLWSLSLDSFILSLSLAHPLQFSNLLFCSLSSIYPSLCLVKLMLPLLLFLINPTTFSLSFSLSRESLWNLPKFEKPIAKLSAIRAQLNS